LVTSESAETFAKARETVAATVRRVGLGRFAPVVHYILCFSILAQRLAPGWSARRRKSDPETPLRQNRNARAQQAFSSGRHQLKFFFRRRFVAKL
jgi:hypothetical protein